MINQNMIDKFKASPMCQLSLSSKELFHSNMLYFLFSKFPTLVNDFCGCKETEQVQVLREEDHIDITIKTPTRKFYIENKVKSIPNKEQLERYMIKKKSDLILLTLIKPTFKISIDPYILRVVTYAELAKMIGKIETKDGYLKALIADYLVLLSVLQEIAKKVIARAESEPLFIDTKILKKLNSIRMGDFAQKLRFSSIVPYFQKACARVEADEITADFTRVWGLLSVKYVIGNHKIGIQIQEGCYRRFIESTNDTSVRKIANALKEKKIWFEGDFIQKDFNVFREIFLYAKTHLDSETIEQLCKRARKDGEYIRKNESKIQRILDSN